MASVQPTMAHAMKFWAGLSFWSCRMHHELLFFADKVLAFWGHASAAHGRRAYVLYTNLA